MLKVPVLLIDPTERRLLRQTWKGNKGEIEPLVLTNH